MAKPVPKKPKRNVVAEEWRLRYANNPYGPILQDFLKTAFTAHSYRWATIGAMDQLRQSTVAELQEFGERIRSDLSVEVRVST